MSKGADYEAGGEDDWLRPHYQPPSDLLAKIQDYMSLNQVRITVRVQDYIELVVELCKQYRLLFVKGRGLWDRAGDRQVGSEEVLRLVRDPENLLTKIQNPGGATYREEERLFLIVARAFCGSLSAAGSLGAVATLRQRD